MGRHERKPPLAAEMLAQLQAMPHVGAVALQRGEQAAIELDVGEHAYTLSSPIERRRGGQPFLRQYLYGIVNTHELQLGIVKAELQLADPHKHIMLTQLAPDAREGGPRAQLWHILSSHHERETAQHAKQASDREWLEGNILVTTNEDMDKVVVAHLGKERTDIIAAGRAAPDSQEYLPFRIWAPQSELVAKAIVNRERRHDVHGNYAAV